MASRKTLFELTYHDDDDTGMYQVGEIDFGITCELEKYIKRYGHKGKNEILAMLGYLAYEVQDTYNKNSKEETCDEAKSVQ